MARGRISKVKGSRSRYNKPSFNASKLAKAVQDLEESPAVTNREVEKPNTPSGARQVWNLRSRTINLTAPFPILKLPTEIRLMIFEYALGGHEITMTSKDNDEKAVSAIHSVKNVHTGEQMRPENFDSLRRICRQFYAETTSIYYKLNVLFFPIPRDLKVWIRNQDPSVLAAVHNLHVRDFFSLDPLKGGPPTFKETFPNLKQVDVNRVYPYRKTSLSGRSSLTDETLHAMIMEGEDEKLNVILHDAPIKGVSC
jgi:hypothetical protein